MKISNILKKEKGITGIDISLAVLIITIFTGVITTLFYNVYTTSINIERESEATYIAVNILEYANLILYDEILTTDNSLLEQYKNSPNSIFIKNGYIVETKVSKHATTQNGKEDVIKNIEVKVKYKVGKKEEVLNIKTLKIKEFEL